MLYEDPVKDIHIENQTLTTNSGKILKYGSLIIATGCTASRCWFIYFSSLFMFVHNVVLKIWVVDFLMQGFQRKLGETYLVFTISGMLQMLMHWFYHW